MQTLPNPKILISFERLVDFGDQEQFLKQALHQASARQTIF
jgi:hypothetical protein